MTVHVPEDIFWSLSKSVAALTSSLSPDAKSHLIAKDRIGLKAALRSTLTSVWNLSPFPSRSKVSCVIRLSSEPPAVVGLDLLYPLSLAYCQTYCPEYASLSISRSTQLFWPPDNRPTVV